MKKNTIVFSGWLLATILLAGCKEDIIGPASGDNTPPNPVMNPVVENLPGAAKISYTLPNDKNLLYVKAVYEIKGVKMEARSSFFKNYIIAEGFGDTQERNVSLYTVSRSEVPSEAVAVKVQPLAPPISSVYGSLDVTETFGGVNVKFVNENKANIAVSVLLDSAGEWVSLDNYYSNAPEGSFSVRGMQAVERKFGVFIRDRWNNHTDTLVKLLTPIYEEELDKGKFADARKKFPVPQIAPLPASGNPMVEAVDYSGSWKLSNLWNNVVGTSNGFHTKEKYDQPVWIPIDLGVTARLSRFKIWQRPGGYLYNHGNPHKWEIWGTNTPTDVNSWVLLGSYTMVKPSGNEAPGVTTSEDTEVGTNGQEYDFLEGKPAVRYIAWKHIDSWASMGGETGHLHMMEMTLWGQVK